MLGHDYTPSGVREAESVVREYQGISEGGLEVPWTFVTLLIGLGVGTVLGPSFLASSDEGSRYLERQIRTKIGSKGYSGAR